MTGVAPLAFAEGQSVFVRLDGQALMAAPDRLIKCLEELYNLFLAGRIYPRGDSHCKATAARCRARRGDRLGSLDPEVGRRFMKNAISL